MGPKKRPEWRYVIEKRRIGNRNPEVECRYCGDIWHSNSVQRIIDHLATCTGDNLPYDIRKHYQPHNLVESIPIDPTILEIPDRSRYREDEGSPPKRLKSIGHQPSHFYDTCNDKQQEEITQAIADLIYGAQLPFSLVENPLFVTLLRKLRPAYKPPSRRHIGGTRLQTTKQATEEAVDAYVKRYKGQLTLVTDGWSNVRNEGIQNYLLTTNHGAIFYKSKRMTERHTAEAIAEPIKEVIEAIGADRIVAVCTDHASNMRAAWHILQPQMPHIEFIGCGAHKVQLLVDDIHKIGDLATVLDASITMIKYFKLSQPRYDLFKKQAINTFKAKDLRSLQLPGKTRWQGKVYSTRSAVHNERIFKMVIMDKSSCIGYRPTPAEKDKYDEIYDIILSDSFWSRLRSYLSLFEPFLKITLAIERGDPHLSHMWAYYTWLQSTVQESEDPFITDIKKEVNEAIRKRFDEAFSALWIVAYACDPKAQKTHPIMIPLKYEDLIKRWLADWCKARQLIEDLPTLWGQLQTLIWHREDLIDDLQWASYFGAGSNYVNWITRTFHKPALLHLKRLAMYALSIAPHTGDCERNWSAFGETHTESRNRLRTDIVNDLIYVGWNTRLLKNIQIDDDAYPPDDYADFSDAIQSIAETENAALTADGM